jgi:nitroreductase
VSIRLYSATRSVPARRLWAGKVAFMTMRGVTRRALSARAEATGDHRDALPVVGVPDNRNLLELLARRHSVGPKYLVEPAPSEAELLQAACVALRAPDHGALRPFRFVRIAAGERERLGHLFAQDAARRGHAAAEVERARQRAHNGPALVALVGRVRDDVVDVPAREQWLCIGAGLMNFLNALHLLGYGAKTLSGASVQSGELQRAFCRDGELLLAWIAVGTPERSPHANRADEAAGVLSDWRA